MNIRDLKYLLAVADSAHFGKAAEKCFVSQPTLSAQLKKLEEELGVRLFERNNKRVLITPIGQIIAAQVRVILQEVEKLKVLAQNAQDPFAGVFHLGIIPTLGPYLLPIIFEIFKKRLPKLNLVVYENKTENILHELQQGRLDAVILALPVSAPNLVVQELFCEPFYVALPKHHPLAKKKSVTLADLEKETLLLLEEGHCLREQALEACSMTAAKTEMGFKATSLETLRHLVAAGAGITLLPALSVNAEKSELAIKSFNATIPSRSIGMLWRDFSARKECCETMAKLISAEVKKHPKLKTRAPLKVMERKLE
ncbi:LysR substrate-binding domain-containing protein [Coxiella burnetii]|uniref:LysR substrate-binding domain-containing protein n=1 Tax=Coxiella burnetii TaxID=777 RepID=UPI000594BAA9|nr:LysR substrate-binding domain-containing protein [Coxiella burnetii]ATN74863.1 transcriptional regulator [Coxiella burnetii]ATN76767.1 transcriptional regulator [Coxiella burnetii]ATN78684.1 transcriptional regulator [Coxiella burnetii]ATN80594.1 transcriptional regulator [Coxiella burnetii]OYK90485.1 DNA-binding transcriptional regulator OxyR [Coxiella burnetii]